MVTGSLTLDATIANTRFTADAVLIGIRPRHDRTSDHTGTQDTTTVTLSTAIGQYPAGTTVQAVLASFATRLSALDSANRRFATFTVNAFVLPRFWANAIVQRSTSGSFTANAVINLSAPASFTVNAVIRTAARSGTFTVGAYVV